MRLRSCHHSEPQHVQFVVHELGDFVAAVAHTQQAPRLEVIVDNVPAVRFVARPQDERNTWGVVVDHLDVILRHRHLDDQRRRLVGAMILEVGITLHKTWSFELVWTSLVHSFRAAMVFQKLSINTPMYGEEEHRVHHQLFALHR